MPSNDISILMSICTSLKKNTKITSYIQLNLDIRKTLYPLDGLSIARNTFNGAYLLKASSNEKAEEK